MNVDSINVLRSKVKLTNHKVQSSLDPLTWHDKNRCKLQLGQEMVLFDNENCIHLSSSMILMWFLVLEEHNSFFSVW